MQIPFGGRYYHTRAQIIFPYCSYWYPIKNNGQKRKQRTTRQKPREIRADRKDQQKIQIIQLSNTDFKIIITLSIFR